MILALLLACIAWTPQEIAVRRAHERCRQRCAVLDAAVVRDEPCLCRRWR